MNNGKLFKKQLKTEKINRVFKNKNDNSNLNEYNNIYNNVNNYIKAIALKKIKKGSIVVDATVGNGNDILYLLKLIGREGIAYGFDIQDIAIKNTQEKIKIDNNGVVPDNCILINDGHQFLDNYVNTQVNFIVFNLGYLPKGDHSIITTPTNTIMAIEKSMKILKKNGCICIATYLSHKGGMDEYDAVMDFLKQVKQEEFNISKIEFINQRNNPPVLFLIEKR